MVSEPIMTSSNTRHKKFDAIILASTDSVIKQNKIKQIQ